MAVDEEGPVGRRCAKALGLTLVELYAIVVTAPKRYKSYEIPKRSGGFRTISQPSRELKSIQYFLINDVLSKLPVHPSAMAYREGSSIAKNALRHVSSRVILKLDFENFFGSIRVADWRRYALGRLPHWSEMDFGFSAQVMFWGCGGRSPICLSIGAPVSPILSNAIRDDFDVQMSRFAAEADLVYTRYADDLTISSNDFLDANAIIKQVQAALARSDAPRLSLNEAKTYLASKARSRRVTGLVLSNEGAVSLGRDRKRLISAMVHRAGLGQLSAKELMTLHGLLAFAHDVEPDFVVRLERKYGGEAIAALFHRHDD